MIESQRQQGKVFLVGAGPGDPDLLTLKGKACLEQADVVLYDHLANPALLAYVPERAERIYVGRRGRDAYSDQSHINALMIAKACEGKRVVRLKGGDPYVFGRGGEEAEAVADAGVPFEVVPGVTSAVAVPCYAGIPVTHRTQASTVAFVTGHEEPGKAESGLEWPRLATSEGTLVFLMGMKNLPQITERLIQEGKDPETPVAVIQWGTYARQRTVVGTLRTIAAHARANNMEPPSVIVVGSVVRLRDRLNWFETRPLFGQRILVTRPRAQAHELSKLLIAYGAEPIECPTLDILPPEHWDDVDRAIEDLPTYDWLIWTSVNGVQAFLNRLRTRGKDIRRLAGVQVCCIGPRTAEEAARYGIVADLVPKEFQAEGIVDVFANIELSGKRVLIPRAAVARDLLPKALQRMGAEVTVVTVYRAEPPKIECDRVKAELKQGAIHYVTFASSSTVRNFCRWFESSEELQEAMARTTIACIGPITAKTVMDEGLPVHIMAEENTIPALVEALVRHSQGKNEGREETR
ncbi:MAG: uroporphyrinogen-III C-methyltransferase [Nitrospirae bacterium]|nr:MAG: uroporphyrinogen-III C-methyltransferase [Nitrospirota bacterium]